MSDREKKTRTGRTDEITIQFMGPKQFRQELVDAIYKILVDDEIQFIFSKPGCGFTFNSSLPPSDEVIL
ncbi:MAG TPA: hypothetical protein PK040_00395 [Anaerolineaceae bacterium]|nr:hypothetical protein [Anaerolineaceae bacterium]